MQDQKKGKRKLHITGEKNRLQQRKQWPTGPKANSLHRTVESLAKTNFLMLLLFPARFAHARYSSRMIDRFLNWGDHGKLKSGKIKGRCQPPLVSWLIKTNLFDVLISSCFLSVIISVIGVDQYTAGLSESCYQRLPIFWLTVYKDTTKSKGQLVKQSLACV